MKYLFTWNSNFLVLEWVLKWKKQFIEKYWEFNLIHIKDINNENFNFLSENLFSTSFLAEKKLIIIDFDNNSSDEKTEFIINNINRIPETNILLINYSNPDKRSSFYKFLSKNFEIKEFNIENENDSFSLIKNKYNWRIDDNAIRVLLKYKSNNLEKIYSEIEKLLILNDNINQETIKKYIIPELEESIFQVIDDILNLDINASIKKIHIILNDTNIYAFYNNLIANIRINNYISYLKNKKVNSSDITNILWLWNRSFLINKNYKISNNKLNDFYIKLIDIDKKLKSWKLLWTTEDDFLFELEKTIIKLAE
jgi:DNA polymerase III delta subunit